MTATSGLDTFDATMEGLKKGLHVAHVATWDLRTCKSEDSVDRILDDPDLQDFDQIPVLQGELYIGVLHRSCAPSHGWVGDHMTPLTDVHLVSAGAPLELLLDLFMDSPYRLVVDGERIRGIVTRSDLLKLPVRLLGFAAITHLEMLMASLIRGNLSEQEWTTRLSEGRKQKLDEKRQALQANLRNPDPLELTEFCDKRDIIRQGIGEIAFHAGFNKDMKNAEELRNRLAHATTFTGNDEELGWFLATMRGTRCWIRRLRESQTRARECPNREEGAA